VAGTAYRFNVDVSFIKGRCKCFVVNDPLTLNLQTEGHCILQTVKEFYYRHVNIERKSQKSQLF